MKGVFVILDGVADLPCGELGGKTPLEAAKTKHLDWMASHGKVGHCYTIKKGVIPESSSAVISLLGYDPDKAPRGILEAVGGGVPFRSGDLVLRTNFATSDETGGIVIDRRVGRTLTTKEARELGNAVNEQVRLRGQFHFYPLIHHRGVVVFKGGFSDMISNVDPDYGFGVGKSKQSNVIKYSEALDDEENSEYSAGLLNQFVRGAHEVLKNHEINKNRVKRGLLPANFILCRDAGTETLRMKPLSGEWCALGYMPLEIGIAKSAGMDVVSFPYPPLKGEAYENLHEGLDRALKAAKVMIEDHKDKYDYFYVHIKETDVPGHDGLPKEKVKMIEKIDATLFAYLSELAKEGKKIVITADHTTACRVRGHTADAVPVLVCDGNGKKQRFTERQGKKGKGIMPGKILNELMQK